MKIIGVMGGSGSGKSTIAQLLKDTTKIEGVDYQPDFIFPNNGSFDDTGMLVNRLISLKQWGLYSMG